MLKITVLLACIGNKPWGQNEKSNISKKAETKLGQNLIFLFKRNTPMSEH